jgi:hypothetical protein
MDSPGSSQPCDGTSVAESPRSLSRCITRLRESYPVGPPTCLSADRDSPRNTARFIIYTTRRRVTNYENSRSGWGESNSRYTHPKRAYDHYTTSRCKDLGIFTLHRMAQSYAPKIRICYPVVYSNISKILAKVKGGKHPRRNKKSAEINPASSLLARCALKNHLAAFI